MKTFTHTAATARVLSPAAVAALTPARFSIEGDPTNDVFPGLHNDACRWNGWATPLFTREVIDNGVGKTIFNDDGLDLAWDGDVCVVTDRHYEGEENVTRVEPWIVDGVAVYDFGMGWVWDTVE